MIDIELTGMNRAIYADINVTLTVEEAKRDSVPYCAASSLQRALTLTSTSAYGEVPRVSLRTTARSSNGRIGTSPRVTQRGYTL